MTDYRARENARAFEFNLHFAKGACANKSSGMTQRANERYKGSQRESEGIRGIVDKIIFHTHLFGHLRRIQLQSESESSRNSALHKKTRRYDLTRATGIFFRRVYKCVLLAKSGDNIRP